MSTALEKYDPKQVNLLLPTVEMQRISPYHTVTFSEVQPSEQDFYKVGEEWNAATRQKEPVYAPLKPFLQRISSCAGIIWNFRDSGPIENTEQKVVYKAIGAVKQADGSWLPIHGTKEINLVAIEEETYADKLSHAKKEKYNNPEAWAQEATRKNMLQWRKTKLARAETGAMLRCIRAALGMKQAYRKEEMLKPFVVQRIDFQPDFADPTVKQALLSAGINNMFNSFGQAGNPALYNPAPFRELPALEAPKEEPIEATFTEIADEEDPPPPEAPPADPAPEQNHQCADCGAAIDINVVNYSLGRFKRPLCRACQRKAGKNGGK